jgi:hypothetical protein
MTQTYPLNYDIQTYTQTGDGTKNRTYFLPKDMGSATQVFKFTLRDLVPLQNSVSVPVDAELLVNTDRISPVTLHYQGYVFVHPVNVRFASEGEQVSALSEEWDSYGLGETPSEALSELASMLVSLRNKFGFQAVPGTKHEALSLIVDGRKVASTRFSRGHAEISDDILTLIARQIGVNLGQLKKMYGCSISKDVYLQLLRDKNRLD